MWTFSFDWNATGYDPNNAYWLARLSRMVYRERPGIQLETDVFWGNPAVTFYEHERKDAQGCLLTYPEGAFLAFRGTESLRDWATNLSVVMKRKGNLRFHGGFLGAVENLYGCRPKAYGAIEEHRRRVEEESDQYLPTLEQSLQALVASGKPVFMCGHSLGGAMACVAALIPPLNGWGGNGPFVYTFGQPRCLSRESVLHIQANGSVQVYQHVNNEDIVPRLPPPSLGFAHIALSHLYDKEGNLNSGSALVKAQNRIKKFRKRINPARISVRDHAMAGYVELIEELRW